MLIKVFKGWKGENQLKRGRFKLFQRAVAHWIFLPRSFFQFTIFHIFSRVSNNQWHNKKDVKKHKMYEKSKIKIFENRFLSSSILMGSGTVGRAVTSYTKGLQFKSVRALTENKGQESPSNYSLMLF